MLRTGSGGEVSSPWNVLWPFLLFSVSLALGHRSVINRWLQQKLLLYIWYGAALCWKSAKAENTYFWILSNPSINKTKFQTLYSDVVSLSHHAQCKFYKDLSFSSIKLSGMKFLPCLFKTRTRGVTPSFSFSGKLFRLQPHYVHEGLKIDWKIIHSDPFYVHSVHSVGMPLMRFLYRILLCFYYEM